MKYLLTLLCFCWYIAAKAQTYNNGYLLGKPAAVFRGIHLVNDTLVAHGYAADAFPPYPVKYVLAKITADGTLQYTHTSMLDSFTDYFTQGRFIITNDSGYAFAGIKGMFEGGLLFKLDKHGALEFYKEYTDSAVWGYGFQNVLQLPDSGYVILGSRSNTNGDKASIVLRTDALGNILWKVPFGSTEAPGSITLLQNGNILVCNAFTFGTGLNYFTNTLFRTLDTAGNIVSTWADTTKKSYEPNAYLQLPDGGGIYVGQWLDTIYTAYNGSTPYYPGLLKAQIVRDDSLHNKLWSLPIGHPSAIPNLFQVKQLNDGNYLAVGGTSDTTYTDGQPYKNTGWLVKFDINGTIIWQRKYFNTADLPGQTNYLYDFVELADGSIIAAGERIDQFNDYPQRGWLLRLDEFGCLVQGCQHVGINNEAEANSYWKVYPNPVNDNLNIYFNAPVSADYSLKLFTADGREMLSVPALENATTYTLSTAHLAAGMYVAQLLKGNRPVSFYKVVKD